jgi:hypothetical protein
MRNVKGNKITYIGDGRTGPLDIKGYLVFEDNWITEYNTELCDESGNEYKVLDYRTTKDYVCNEHSSCYSPSYRWVTRACVKLDKNVDINKLLYTKL